MIVRQRQVHDRTNEHLTADRARHVLDRMHAQDSRLRRIDDGRPEKASEPPLGLQLHRQAPILASQLRGSA